MKKILIILLSLLILSSCGKDPFQIDTTQINLMDYDTEELNVDLHSAEYLVIDISDCDFLYAKGADQPILPASLTKLATLDTVLNLFDDLDDTSYVTYDQVEDLIREDASLAYIRRDTPYSLRDLLYGLVLPSGADAAVALENYFFLHDLDLVEEMNRRMEELGAQNTHFVNTTGLHDDSHYTSLNDLYLVVMDLLKYEEGRKILNSLSYVTEDDLILRTTIGVAYRDVDFKVLGGKTGYTPEAGQNIIVLCRDNKGKSYLIMTANAYGDYSKNQYWHYDDVESIFKVLYAE